MAPRVGARYGAPILRSVQFRFILAIALIGAATGWLSLWRRRPRAHAWRLTDGTVVYFRTGTTIEPAPGFPHPRTLRVNGDLVVTAPDLPEPLTVQSRLLSLTLSQGAAVRVTAFAGETGEEAEVLRGRVVAQKAYPSRQSSPDQLAAGEMVMVNQTIDLMEKEKDPPGETERWSQALINSAGEPQAK